MMHLSDLVELLRAMMKHLEPPRLRYNDPLENMFQTYKNTEQIIRLSAANDFSTFGLDM